MQQNDIIMVNVTGTNGSTRNQKTISRRFSGAGLTLNDNGQPDGGNESLSGLPSDTASLKAPDFPAAEFAKAQAQGVAGLPAIKAIQIAYAQQLEAYEKTQGGGNEKLQIAKSVLEYTKKFHGFKETDGDHFVMKLENLDVVETTLPDKRTMYTVTGTAVFGATARAA